MTRNERGRMAVAGGVLVCVLVLTGFLYSSIGRLRAEAEETEVVMGMMVADVLRFKMQNEGWAGMEAEIVRLKREVKERDASLGEMGRVLDVCRSTRTDREQEVLALYAEIGELDKEMGALRAVLVAEKSHRDIEMGIIVGDLGTVVVKGKIYLSGYIPAGEVLPLDDLGSLTYSVEQLFQFYQLRIEALKAEIAVLKGE